MVGFSAGLDCRVDKRTRKRRTGGGEGWEVAGRGEFDVAYLALRVSVCVHAWTDRRAVGDDGFYPYARKGARRLFRGVFVVSGPPQCSEWTAANFWSLAFHS